MCVPPNAARALLFGYLRIDLGVVFGYTDFSFSDGARQAIADGKADIVRDVVRTPLGGSCDHSEGLTQSDIWVDV